MLNPFIRYDSGLFNNFPFHLLLCSFGLNITIIFITCKQCKGIWMHQSLIVFNIFTVALHYIKICTYVIVDYQIYD